MAYYLSQLNPAPSIIAYSLSFIVLLIGSITDLKTREVPDWLNYGLIMAGVGLNLLFSAIYSASGFIINSIIGLAIFFGIAYLMFHTGQWGGGDSKILMGLGAMIGLDVSFRNPQLLFDFFINSLLIGAAYGLLWSLFLLLKNKERFLSEFNKELSKKGMVLAKKLLLAAVFLSFAVLFFIKPYYLRIMILAVSFLAVSTFYLFAFAKAIERACMHKEVEPAKLTEGDWIVNDIFVGKQYICGPKDLGIEKKQIKKLVELYKHGKIKKVLIKEGIPFVPSFLIAFIVTFVFGNFIMGFV